MNDTIKKDTNCLSSLSFAALLTAAGCFSLSLYMPREGENAALTAVTAAVSCLIKLPLFLAAAKLAERLRDSRIFHTALAAAAVFFMILGADSFSEMTVSAYPERCTKLTTVAVLLFICCYTASTGLAGTARTAGLILFGFAAVCIPVMFEMRGSMLTDRLDLFSPDPAGETVRTALRLSGLFCEPVIFMGLIGDTEGDVRLAVKPYLIAQAIVSGIFFLMCGAVMGRFFGSSGYAFYALSYNTHGAFIDRANGIFTFFASAFAILTISALMIVLRRSFDAVFRVESGEPPAPRKE